MSHGSDSEVKSVTDFHTHVLPGIDDGSKDIETSFSMIKEAASQGVHRIVATPHFYADKVSISHFLEQRKRAAERTIERLDRESMTLPELRIGAEVHYFRGMGTAARLKALCIEETNTILLEMPFEQWTWEMYKDVEDILEAQDLQVVFAHIERYPQFQKKADVWDAALDLPVTLQVNAGSFLRKGGFFSGRKKQKLSMDILREHPHSVIGSDCHNMDTRRPNLAAGRAEIEHTLGKKALCAIDEAAEQLL